MGCYNREPVRDWPWSDDFPEEPDEYEPEEEDDRPSDEYMQKLAVYRKQAEEQRRRLQRPITCRGCGAQEMLSGDSWMFVYGQMRLYRRGWRRDPDTQNDYCAQCAEIRPGSS